MVKKEVASALHMDFALHFFASMRCTQHAQVSLGLTLAAPPAKKENTQQRGSLLLFC